MQPPSIRRILLRDWPCLSVLMCFALLCAVLGLIAGVVPNDLGRSVALALIGLITTIVVVVIAHRVRRIQQVFATGQAVTGRVTLVGENSEQVGYAVVAMRSADVLIGLKRWSQAATEILLKAP